MKLGFDFVGIKDLVTAATYALKQIGDKNRSVAEYNRHALEQQKEVLAKLRKMGAVTEVKPLTGEMS